jgi:citrate synthase
MTSKEKSRDDVFVSQIATKIWLESPAQTNAYIAEKHYCHGYEHKELMQNLTMTQNIHLLFTGEVPNKETTKNLDYLMMMPLAIGPRHPASRAAMNAGVSKTKLQHLLPISLEVLSGNNGGAQEVFESHGFISSNSKLDCKEVLFNLIENKTIDNLTNIAPGFGTVYGGVDVYAKELADQCKVTPQSKYFKWASDFENECSHIGYGWRLTGLFAAMCLEFGYTDKQAVGLFQMACAPLLYSFAVEKSQQPLTAMPFIKDENYTIE